MCWDFSDWLHCLQLYYSVNFDQSQSSNPFIHKMSMVTLVPKKNTLHHVVCLQGVAEIPVFYPKVSISLTNKIYFCKCSRHLIPGLINYIEPCGLKYSCTFNICTIMSYTPLPENECQKRYRIKMLSSTQTLE